MRRLAILLFIFASQLSFAQKGKKAEDVAAIKQMCGCYEVSFDFAETFNYADAEDYQPSAIKHSRGLEWAQLVEESPDKLVLQHLLIVGPKERQSVIKHWRQDWIYENRDFYTFHVNNEWKYQEQPKAAVKGQWTQKVYQVDDSPRYEGSASWVHVDGKSYWENTTDAPLPRREYTKRNDYNVTVRQNRHEITAEGWVHEQDNQKVVRSADKADFVLAEEKGYNRYKKVDDSRCQAAQDWWTENASMWASVRANWDEVFARKQDLVLKPKVEDKRLYEHLFALDNKVQATEIQQIITNFIQ
jgi:hypothetical protein